MKENSAEDKYLRSAKLIISDEASMIPAIFLDVLNDLLKDITGFDQLFDGISVLPSGDFRQTIPVIPKALPQACTHLR